MSSNDHCGPDVPAPPETDRVDEGPMSRRKKFRLVVKVVELRLRFIALMAITGLAFAYWDTLWNHYEKWMRPAAERQAALSGIEYYCPMHPQVVQDEPGSCPICGMPLAKRKKGEQATLPEGVTARVQLSPARVQQAGIRTAQVSYAPLAQTLTTIGSVAYDERRMAKIVSKVPGKTRVEKLHVNYKGMDVRAGDPLADLYSPELDQAVQELLTASRRAEDDPVRLRTAAGRSLLGDHRELVRLSAEKLKRWGITQPQIDAFLKAGHAGFTIPIFSPIGGHVVAKNVVEGEEVQEGFTMFEIADLETVWVLAQVYEHQIGLVRERQRIEAVVEGLPGEVFSGKVEFVQPHLDPATRTVEVRYALDNPGHRLRPGMFATVTLRSPVADTPAFQARLAAGRPSPHEGRPVVRTAEQQGTCPVTNLKLGAMGQPIAVEVEGRKVWTCCGACPPRLKAQPARYLTRMEAPPRDQVLSVPESAVIDTGPRKIVYIETQPGVFDGREVVLGPRIGDRFPVLEGLAAGEKVAAAGAFLIDAESRINPGAAPAATGGPATVAEAPIEAAHRH